MSTTLKMLRDQIILDANISGDVNFPDLRLNRIINLSQRYVQTALDGLGMRKWEKSAGLTLAPGLFVGIAIKTSPVPTNMAESPKAIKFVDVTDGTRNGLAFEIGENLFFENITNTFLTPTISKPKFARLANNILLSPATITSGTIYYYGVVTDLVNDGDSSEIPSEFDDNVIKRAIIDIDVVLGKIQDKQVALADLDKTINDSWQKFLGKKEVIDSQSNKQ